MLFLFFFAKALSLSRHLLLLGTDVEADVETKTNIRFTAM